MENLELPESSREGLAEIVKDSTLPLEALDIILDTIFHNLLRLQKSDAAENVDAVLTKLQGENLLAGTSKTKLASHVGCVSTFISICARQNATEDLARSFLTTCKWDTARINTFIKYYTPTRPKIRAYLQLFGNQTTKLVDIDWRLDLQHKNGEGGLTNDITYIISFKLDNCGKEEVVHFCASKPELEDLVSVLREASYALKRVTS